MTWQLCLLLIWIGFSGAWLTHAAVLDAHSAASLQASYTRLGERLHHSPFQQALVLDSSESPNDLEGDVYALVKYPFATVSVAFNSPEHWCDVLILPINTKYCHATHNAGTTLLMVNIGKKTPQPVDDAYPIEFLYRVAAATPNYLEIQLSAGQGPLGTRNYLIQLQAIPVGKNQTFLHLVYTFSYGSPGRLAMQTYLATVGSGKVGFTLTGNQTDGQPDYIDGMRGLMERNAMRYYLAINAYLDSLSTPPPMQLQNRLRSWFDGSEQFPRQLHEIDRAAYISMKNSEYLRQQTVHLRGTRSVLEKSLW
ncbi:MAG: hypothetical protein ABL892_09145 [Thiobacillaceae bacterium]